MAAGDSGLTEVIGDSKDWGKNLVFENRTGLPACWLFLLNAWCEVYIWKDAAN